MRLQSNEESTITIAVIVFVVAYGAIAIPAAYGLYKLDRGYEEEPELDTQELWQQSIYAGIAAGVLAGGLLLISRVVQNVAGEESTLIVRYGFLIIEWIAWTLYCVWLCDLASLEKGILYAMGWGLLKAGVQFVVFYLFGISFWFATAS